MKMDRNGLDLEARAYLEEADARNQAPLISFGREEAGRLRNEINAEILKLLGPPVNSVSVREVRVPGFQEDITLRIYSPPADGPFGIFFYIHGGGFVIGNLETHDRTCANICKNAGSVVVSVDYHLAPEHPFPVPLEDCYSAFRWITEHTGELKGKDGLIAVGGDSAGGNLTAALTLLARDRGVRKIGYQILIYPAVDFFNQDTESIRLFTEGFGLTLDDAIWFSDCYLPDKGDQRNPLASPLLAEDLSGLPPAHVITAGYDILRDGGRSYAEKLRLAGVPVTETCYENQIHGFLNYDGIIRAAYGAFEDIAVKLKEFFG
ncbi:MAG: alpha/beta hydrolase [Spirochaetales bacterium]|nr:MAG: alpha/beta hydrolase [Spirochaetales bacterium]